VIIGFIFYIKGVENILLDLPYQGIPLSGILFFLLNFIRLEHNFKKLLCIFSVNEFFFSEFSLGINFFNFELILG